MPIHPMIPPGFEHLYPLGPTSAGLTQPGLKSEPRTAPESYSDPRVGMPGTSRKRAGVPPRFFSLEDEIALLNGMMRFADMYKCSPFKHLNSFRVFIKPDLDADPNTLQLKSKLQKFRLKYDRNVQKETSGGRAKKLRAHERRAYELSKLVWANPYIKAGKMAEADKDVDLAASAGGPSQAVNVAVVASAGGPSQAENVAVVESAGGPSQAENVDLAASAGGPSQAETTEILSVDDVSINRTKILTIGAQLFEKGKGVDGESEWHQLRQAEFGVHLKMAELIRTKTDALNA